MKQIVFTIPLDSPEISLLTTNSMIQATPGAVDAAKIAKVELPRGIPRSRLSVWLVDGKLIRDSLPKTDYVGGGHFFKFQWIPEGEIWIEKDTPTGDVKYYMLHELCERAHMALGMEYEEAHARAARKEAWCRKHPNFLDECISRAIVRNIEVEKSGQ